MNSIDHAVLHAYTIDLLYGALALLTFVIIERLLTYLYLGINAGRIARAIRQGAGLRLTSGDLLSRSVQEYVAAQQQGKPSRAQIEDLSAALFLRVDGRITARLWILDTIVTAAPLLGLLGTILGIMDTFSALSSGGISDPAAVSRGIAAALIATAIGIGTALYGLVGFNLLHRQAENLTEAFKSFLLRTTFE
jgi:biopolymer transport protein ExbB